MLQIGAALEALGYAIWLYDENGGEAPTCGKRFCKGTLSSCQMPGCNKPNAAKYFERVSEDIPLTELGIAPEESAETWSQAFNKVYKGCKHADNSLPDGEEAYFRAKQGLQVIRCWLAKRLGVSDITLVSNKKFL